MCESHAYMNGVAGESLVMEDVVLLAIEGDEIILTSLLGDEMRIPATIKEIAFTDHRIVLSPLGAGRRTRVN